MRGWPPRPRSAAEAWPRSWARWLSAGREVAPNRGRVDGAMSPTVRKALVGLALAGGIAGVGAGLAYAQTSTTTPPTTSPPTTTAPDRSAPANPAPDDSGRRH